MMKKIATLMMALIICFNLTALSLATNNIGDTTICDEKGTTYSLSNSILGTTSLTFWDDMETDNTRTVTVYLVPKDTIITLPTGSDYYVALWYTPDERVRGGWDSFLASELIPGGTELPFDLPIKNADGTDSTTSARESSTLRIFSVTSLKSIFIRGIDTSDSGTSSTPFKDIPVDAYYLEAVTWALDKDITTGTGANTFSPNKTCTRGEIMTFLWRAQTKPISHIVSLYTDVSTSDYYFEAARWGYSLDMVPPPIFAADTACTRSMTMMYLWKAWGSPSAKSIPHFSDIPDDADYMQAVAWAVENGITSGTSESTFSPDKICTRAEIMTFLYRVKLAGLI